MVRFVHIADAQVGMRAKQVGTAADTVREERVRVLKRVAELAKERAAAFLLLAGDTFEDHAIDRLWVQKVADALAPTQVPVYLLPGNHDPLFPGSVWEEPVWTRSGNLHVLDSRAALEVADGVTLLPCPCTAKYSDEDPTAWIEDTDALEGIRIGVAHGSLLGIPEIADDDHPIPPDAADRARLDYLALGHWHSLKLQKARDGAERTVYPGTPESTKFEETGAGNALVVEIDGPGTAPRIEPVRVARLHWEKRVETFSAAGDAQALRDALEEAIPVPADEPTHLLDLRVDGLIDPSEMPVLEEIERLVESRCLFARIDRDGLRPLPRNDDWLGQLPAGPVRMAAEQLLQASQADTPAGKDAPDPAAASRALLELYRLHRQTEEPSA